MWSQLTKFLWIHVMCNWNKRHTFPIILYLDTTGHCPFGNGLNHLFMVIFRMVFLCFTHIAPAKTHGFWAKQSGGWGQEANPRPFSQSRKAGGATWDGHLDLCQFLLCKKSMQKILANHRFFLSRYCCYPVVIWELENLWKMDGTGPWNDRWVRYGMFKQRDCPFPCLPGYLCTYANVMYNTCIYLIYR